MSTTVPLNKYLAQAGVCSRRKAEEEIKAGRVTVNQKVITQPGHPIVSGDTVLYLGRVVGAQEHVYLVMNKPKGYVTTVFDEHNRKKVVDLLPKDLGVRVYPVGRLDKDSTGVLLLTNDGELANRLSHPSHEIKKVYHVTVDPVPSHIDLARMRKGIILSDGRAAVDRIYFAAGTDKKVIGVELHSGKNRVIRRMFAALGFKVRSLSRVEYAGITVKRISKGDVRFLTDTEVKRLHTLVGKGT